MIRTAVFLAAALAIGAGDTLAQEPTKYSPDNPFIQGPERKTLEERFKEEDAIRARSWAIGMSPSITCGKKIVTIPLIIEGKHVMSLTVWKSDIVRIAYVPPGAIEGDRAGARAITDSIHIHTKEMPRDELGLVTTKRNYAPLLECLDQD